MKKNSYNCFHSLDSFAGFPRKNNDIQCECGKPSHDNFKGGTEISYIEAP